MGQGPENLGYRPLPLGAHCREDEQRCKCSGRVNEHRLEHHVLDCQENEFRRGQGEYMYTLAKHLLSVVDKIRRKWPRFASGRFFFFERS